MPRQSIERTGTQSIGRAAAMLRVVAEHNSAGLRLVELSELLSLERPTVHRIARSLVAEGLLFQDESRRYHLGHGAVALGLAASKTFNLREITQPILERMARETGDTFYLNQRIGSEAVCLIRTDGACPIKIYSVGVGDRRPLGVGAGGLAILSAMGEAERESLLLSVQSQLGNYKGLTLSTLRRFIRRTHALGYALHDVHGFAGIQAIGVAIISPRSGPVAAVSVASVASCLTIKRTQELVDLLRESARQIERLTENYYW
ncbi:IclR family transcriptional regulator [Pigmentiphaga kullae]|uniref:IclR family transcriptional regulator n=1 Tax=Pigmentiphaga kullae TaxID=151784 RepID=A0A4V2F479_9BURK|nr:IclR family transcriptional regulator C-terminal domain-containing protein [Pigmentiphaga kullae]RZS86667.1 IclR family transcriptional regulator [Pigmentiphaga kullae]